MVTLLHAVNRRERGNASNWTPFLVNSQDWLSRNLDFIGSLCVPTVLLCLAVSEESLFPTSVVWIVELQRVGLKRHSREPPTVDLRYKMLKGSQPPFVTLLPLFCFVSSSLFSATWISRRHTFCCHKTTMCCHFFYCLCPWECGIITDQQCNCSCSSTVNSLKRQLKSPSRATEVDYVISSATYWTCKSTQVN